jgi:hypothetical protein
LKCIICDQSVFGKQGMTAVGLGAIHRKCFPGHSMDIRVFQSLDVSALNQDEFIELKEIVMAEANVRDRESLEASVELF